MNYYERYFLPHLIHCACGLPMVQRQRAKVVPQAYGTVLEIGMGSGLNIPFYDSQKVDRIWGLEPSGGMRNKALSAVQQSPIEIQWLDLPGEEIPLDGRSVDSIVLTYTLCTIPDWKRALEQMRRVLKPDGQLLFCEHGESPDIRVRKWQHRLNTVWGKIAGGCHLDRPIPRYLQEGGFVIQEMETGYIPGPRFAAFNYWGTAKAK